MAIDSIRPVRDSSVYKGLIIASPMPGELAEGHLCRIGIVNGIRSRAATLRLIRPPPAGIWDSVLLRLALYSGIKVQEYAREHSLFPQDITAVSMYDQRHFSEDIWTTYYCGAINAGLDVSRICRVCLEEDIDRYGFSWFHREHAFETIEWCPKHEEALYFTSSKDPFYDMPHLQWRRGNVQCLKSIPGIKRKQGTPLYNFTNITYELLQRKSTFCERALYKVLRNRANEKGLNTGSKDKKPLLSDYIKSCFPIEWINKNFPSLGTKEKESGYWSTKSRIDRYSNWWSSMYALVIAALYCSWEEFTADYNLQINDEN